MSDGIFEQRAPSNNVIATRIKLEYGAFTIQVECAKTTSTVSVKENSGQDATIKQEVVRPVAITGMTQKDTHSLAHAITKKDEWVDLESLEAELATLKSQVTTLSRQLDAQRYPDVSKLLQSIAVEAEEEGEDVN